MCGIVGYSGFRNASKILLEGLGKLEYRGYDFQVTQESAIHAGPHTESQVRITPILTALTTAM